MYLGSVPSSLACVYQMEAQRDDMNYKDYSVTKSAEPPPGVLKAEVGNVFFIKHVHPARQ